ncbi:MAG: DUF6713 family protein [Chloroflexota bacterium]
MEITADFIFLCGVTWLVIHELDAIKQRGWRFFFAAVPVSDEITYRASTALHVLLLAL